MILKFERLKEDLDYTYIFNVDNLDVHSSGYYCESNMENENQSFMVHLFLENSKIQQNEGIKCRKLSYVNSKGEYVFIYYNNVVYILNDNGKTIDRIRA